MKSLFIIFALLIFPVQVTWGMMDVYCKQEQRIGIEQCMDCPQTSTAAHSDQDPDGPGASTLNLDCSQCGFAGIAIDATRPGVSAFIASAATNSIDSSLSPSAIGSRPERPQWFPHA